MAFTRTYDLPQLPTTPACVHLRSKTIYVAGRRDPSDEDIARFGNSGCWCNLTQHMLGPDQTPVTQQECTPNRDCYRATY